MGMAKCADKVIDPAPIIKALAERCLEAKGLECTILGDVIDMLRSAPAVHNAPYWATEAAYKNGYADGKPQWIPVSERLPEKGDNVLGFIEGLTGTLTPYVEVYTYIGDGKWEDSYEIWNYGDLVGITHWMPLPEPPKP